MWLRLISHAVRTSASFHPSLPVVASCSVIRVSEVLSCTFFVCSAIQSPNAAYALQIFARCKFFTAITVGVVDCAVFHDTLYLMIFGKDLDCF